MSNIHDVMSSADLSAAVTAIATAYAKKEKAIRERNPMSPGVARVPRVVVGIAGRPGSGKTTATTILAEAVEQQLRSSSNPHRRSPGMLDSELPREVRWIYQQETGVQVVTMPMDGYHLTKKELSEMPNATEAFARRGAEWTFSPEKLTADLRALTTPNIGGTFDDVLVPSFDHAAGDPMERDVSIPGTAGVVLVEGNYLLYRGTPAWAAVNACFDLTIFLHCDRDQCMERLCRRHMKAWSISRAEAMKRAAGSDTINGDLIDTTKPNADVVIHSIEVHHSKL